MESYNGRMRDELLNLHWWLRVSDHREHPDRTIVNSNIGAS
jgi:hypothetical protein